MGLTLLLTVCYAGPATAIVNGISVDPKMVPYVVQLMINGHPACTATIVGENVLVTAAHCHTGKIKKDDVYFAIGDDRYSAELYPSRYYSQRDWEDTLRDQSGDPHDLSVGWIKRRVSDVPRASLCTEPPFEVDSKVLLFGYGEADRNDAIHGLRKGANVIGHRAMQGRSLILGPNRLGHANHGDSGGPIFAVDSTGHSCVGAIISKGNTTRVLSIATLTTHPDSVIVLREFEKQHHATICGVSDAACPTLDIQ